MSFKSIFILIFILIPLSHSQALVEENYNRDKQIAGILENCSQESIVEQARCYEDSLRALIGIDGFDPEALALSLNERALISTGKIRFDFKTIFAEWSFEASSTGELLEKCFTTDARLYSQKAPIAELFVFVGERPILEVRNEIINPVQLCKVLLSYALENDLKREIDPDRFFVFSQIWRRNDPGVSISVNGVFSSKDEFILACQRKATSELSQEVDEYSVIVTDGLRDWSEAYYDSKNYWSNETACRRVSDQLP